MLKANQCKLGMDSVYQMIQKKNIQLYHRVEGEVTPEGARPANALSGVEIPFNQGFDRRNERQ